MGLAFESLGNSLAWSQAARSSGSMMVSLVPLANRACRTSEVDRVKNCVHCGILKLSHVF